MFTIPYADPEETALRLNLGSRLNRMTAGAGPVVLLVAFAAVGGLNLQRMNEQGLAVDFPEAMEFVAALQAIEMPQEVNGLRRITDAEHERRTQESLFAEHSVVWRYADEQQGEYLVSCDFPYAGGRHDLIVCYRGIGRQLEASEVVELNAESARPPYELATIDFKRPDGGRLSVTYTAALIDGTALEAPADGFSPASSGRSRGGR